MLRNELKEILPVGWKKEFKHRKDWDPEGYSVAAFKLKETDKRETVLAKFDETEDIMDYFFDDKPYNYEFDLDKALRNFLNKDNNNLYKFSKEYIIYGGNFGKGGTNLTNRVNDIGCEKDYYPSITLCGSSIGIHRLIAFLFVPNPNPDKYDQVNHIDMDKTNFKKENLEWCDAKWNSQRNNQKEYKTRRLYLRESDNKIFTSLELSKEYEIKQHMITTIINNMVKSNQKYKGSSWKIINPTLNEYLLMHPLRDDWYPHPAIKNLFANACGVIKFNNELRIGSLNSRGSNQPAYYICINNKKYLLHRILAECYFGRILLDSEIIDHVNPVINGIDNSIDNLRICPSQKENMNNKKTRLALSSRTILSDLFGNNIKVFPSKNDLFDYLSIEKQHNNLNNRLVLNNNYLAGNDESYIKNKLKYMYYKWEIDSDGNKTCIKAGQDLGPLCDDYDRKTGSHIPTKLRKYLNTGMPAPDGFYYQQGDPKNMIYDPTNTKLEKKRPEIHWKDRDKN